MKNKSNIFLFILAIAFVITGFIYKGDSRISGDETKVGLNIGNKAPDIEFNNPEGKSIALSSLKGRIVLLDFWASWCRPCRMDNPNVVRAYHKYKEAKFQDAKGFTVYSVSLDRAMQAWKNAIVQDKLEWKNHVSDLKSWSSAPAKVYRVNSIPSNFLLDADGIIIGRNLRGSALDAALAKLLKQPKQKKGSKSNESIELHITK